MKPFLRYALRYGTAAALALIFVTNLMVYRAGGDRLYDSVADVPARRVGLLLGTTPYNLSGDPNGYFTERVRAASALFASGKIGVVLVSGDNERRNYNEPEYMRSALLELGVPPQAIVLDYAGFRTLDSVIRASAVFGQQSFTIVSQEFHNRRALYIARRHGIDAIAFSAPLGRSRMDPRLALREVLARSLAVFDAYVLRTQPRFLGDPVEIAPAQ